MRSHRRRQNTLRPFTAILELGEELLDRIGQGWDRPGASWLARFPTIDFTISICTSTE